MLIKRKTDLQGTKNVVSTAAYTSTRFLLREDGIGLTLTDIYLNPGIDAVYHYPHHLEIAYCLEGKATLENLEDGIIHEVTPGFIWATTKERFRFKVLETVRLICVFNPALVGPEIADKDGSFPLLQ
jgi:L-ectoine synthase